MKKTFLPALLLAVFIFPCIAQSTDTGLTGSWKCRDEFGFTHNVILEADKTFVWTIGGNNVDGMANGAYSVDGEEIIFRANSRHGNISPMFRETESFSILLLDKTTLHLKNKAPQNPVFCDDLTFTDWDSWNDSAKEKAPAAEEKPVAKELNGMLGIDFGTDRQTVIDTMTKNGWEITSQSDEAVAFSNPDYKHFNSFVKVVGFKFKDNLFCFGRISFYSPAVVDDLLKEVELFAKEYNLGAEKFTEQPGLVMRVYIAQNGNYFIAVAITEKEKAFALAYCQCSAP